MNTPPRIGITVLGATGSIGLSTLDVIARHAEQYNVARSRRTAMSRACCTYVARTNRVMP
jgi:1-deoxy-D-xylulose 5-phosphate reductoisomerase